MMDILLSIVVPTKNRFEFLVSFIKQFLLFNENNIELVIQDNSDDNTEIRKYLEEIDDVRINYYYSSNKLSQTENSDLAVKNANGEYVCYMGDDDIVSKYLYEFTQVMKLKNIESCSFMCANYGWPGLQYKFHKFPDLIIKKYKGRIEKVDIPKEYTKLLKKGAVSLNNLPQVYHGVVKKTLLDEMYSKLGTYFPGSSPDIANAIGLSKYCKSHIKCDVPYVSSGKSPKSAAGLGAKHAHVGKIGEIDQLPANLEKKWFCNIPKVWTGQTIYAQSAHEAIYSLGVQNCDLKKFNYNYLFGCFKAFHPNLKNELQQAERNEPTYCGLKSVFYYWVTIFVRSKFFVRNYILTHKRNSKYVFDNVDNSLEAAKIINNEIKRISIEDMFNKL